jgi:hypothetical protein
MQDSDIFSLLVVATNSLGQITISGRQNVEHMLMAMRALEKVSEMISAQPEKEESSYDNHTS